MNLSARERVFLALDTSDLEEIRALAERFGAHVGGFKIGSVAIVEHGIRRIIAAMRDAGPAGKNIFADLKLHDIPETMIRTARAAAEHSEIAFINIHTDCGPEGMRKVAEVKGRAKLLGVTALTSMGKEDLAQIYGSDPHASALARRPVRPVHDFVLERMRMAEESRCDGVVCSAQEVEFLRMNASRKRFIYMTPGIRPKWAQETAQAKNDDQKRVMTPREAILAGATYLVIGRPILEPPDAISPVAAARLVVTEVENAIPEGGQ